MGDCQDVVEGECSQYAWESLLRTLREALMDIGRIEQWEKPDGKVVVVKHPPSYDLNSATEYVGRAPVRDPQGRTGKLQFPIPVKTFCTPEDLDLGAVCPDHLVKVAFEHYDACLKTEVERLQKQQPRIVLPNAPLPKAIKADFAKKG